MNFGAGHAAKCESGRPVLSQPPVSIPAEAIPVLNLKNRRIKLILSNRIGMSLRMIQTRRADIFVQACPIELPPSSLRPWIKEVFQSGDTVVVRFAVPKKTANSDLVEQREFVLYGKVGDYQSLYHDSVRIPERVAKLAKKHKPSRKIQKARPAR
jgi:hypothetical protein